MKLRVLFGVFGVALGISASAQTALIKKLDRYSSTAMAESEKISAERKEQLSSIASTILTSNRKNGSTSLVFTDRNNSSASQAAQVFMQAAVYKYNLSEVNVFSAGTSEGAVDKQCIALLKDAGFSVDANTTFASNPRYLVNYSWNENRVMLFSKLMSNYQIPAENLIIIPLDGSDMSAPEKGITLSGLNYGELNNETVKQIAREMFFIAEKVKNTPLLSHKQ